MEKLSDGSMVFIVGLLGVQEIVVVASKCVLFVCPKYRFLAIVFVYKSQSVELPPGDHAPKRPYHIYSRGPAYDECFCQRFLNWCNISFYNGERNSHKHIRCSLLPLLLYQSIKRLSRSTAIIILQTL